MASTCGNFALVKEKVSRVFPGLLTLQGIKHTATASDRW